jgi:hypothetical protein
MYNWGLMSPFIFNELDIDTDDIADKVFRLQSHWISRSDEFPFYTLGRCSYLDGKTQAYQDEVKVLNPILLKEFDILYGIIIDRLSNQFNEPIAISHRLAVPSFHIFMSHPFLLTHAGHWHQDYPHITLGLKPVDPYTFTVAIKLPTGGGGMDYIEDGIQRYFPYAEKEMIGHDGTVLHRIAGLREYVKGEYRITLQGHLIRIDDVLTMFW